MQTGTRKSLGWRHRAWLLLAVAALCVVVVNGAFYEDPHKVLGIKRSASEAEIKRAYRAMALKWHPDKNSGNPDAEKQFMRIGAAYEQLTNGGGGGSSQQSQQRNGYGYGHGNQNGRGWNHQQQQWQWQQQQQRQRQYYQQQQNMPTIFPFALSTMMIVGVLVWVMIILPSYLQADSTSSSSSSSSSSSTSSANQRAKPTTSEAKPPDKPRASAHDQIARVFAPSLFAFNPLYLTARGRRLVLFFPDASAFGHSVRDQFMLMEKLAAEYARDPLTFCWLDLSTLSASEQATWQQQFTKTAGSSASPFLAAFSTKGKKLSLFTPPRTAKVDVDDVRQWISRLLGGEIAQEETIATLFGMP